MDADLILGYGIALGLGLLVGFQRQRVGASLAGIRTFALVTLLGAVAAHVSLVTGLGWTLAASMIVLGALLVSGHAARSRSEDPELTTEVAAVVMAVVGALSLIGQHQVAVTIGATVALLLHFKPQMHATIERLEETDVRGVMTLVLVGLLILPLVPDRALDPLGVLNPRSVWRMVVLIVGVGMAAHVAYRVFGERKGTLLAGF